MREPSPLHQENVDTPELAEARGGKPFYMHNRKDRRRLAKAHKLFKGRDREAWRIANQHMASEAAKQVRFGEELNQEVIENAGRK